jgi:6-phosphogluconate dehydrogenase
MDIGFIGLGTMGSRIVANLLKAGNTVRVWNRSRPSVDAHYRSFEKLVLPQLVSRSQHGRSCSTSSQQSHPVR